MAQLYANNAYGSLASSASAVTTTLTLASGNGARFPSPTGGDFFLATLIGLDGNGNESSWEIVKCTARATDTLTVARAQESTTAAIWAGGTRIELRATAGGFETYLADNQPSTISVNDTNAALTITQTGTGNALVVEDSANPDATPFVITGDGTAVFGATATTTNVSTVASKFQIVGIDGPASSQTIARWSNGATGAGAYFYKSRGATVGSNTIVQSEDVVGTLGFWADDGATPIYMASIGAVVDGTPGTNDMPGRLIFATTPDGSSTPTERMRIDSAGNLGLGATLPTGNLTVSSDSATVIHNTAFSSVAATTSANVSIRRWRGSAASPSAVLANDRLGSYLFAGATSASNISNTASIECYAAENYSDTASGSYLTLSTTANGAIGRQERVRIDSSGNLLFQGGRTVGVYNATSSSLGFSGGTTFNTDGASIALRGSTSAYNIFGMEFYAGGSERMRLDTTGNLVMTTGSIREVRTALAANEINLNLGNYFTKTISGATTLTVSNVPAAGTVASFILDITNAGGNVTWWTGVKWAGGTIPSLTASGRDVLGFFTHDGGTTWTGLVLGKAMA